MTHTWIVGVDGSDNSRHALNWAIAQAAGRDTRIVVLATWSNAPEATAMSPFTVVAPNWSDVEQDLRAATERLVAEVRRDGVHVEAAVAQGPASQVLVDASRGADLLVVGARGLGRLKGMVLGSVSHRCVSHSSCPTAVIGADVSVEPARRVVVGYDGSPNANAAAAWALGFAAEGSEITILDALALAPWLSPELVRQQFPTQVAAAEQEFAAHMAELDPSGRATHSFVIADARLAISDAAQQADLLVVGARGRGRLAAILGSTTNWLLHGSPCATVVVPHQREH